MKKFSTVLADPPWKRTDANGPTSPPHELRFPTMKINDIQNLPVPDIVESRAHLWLWSLNSTMEQAYSVVRAWGFEPVSVLTWCKTSLGRSAPRMYFRVNTEQLIFAVKGWPRILPDKPIFGTWLETPRTGTTAVKPDAFYEIIESVSKPEYVELFARRSRIGWSAWGNTITNDIKLS